MTVSQHIYKGLLRFILPKHTVTVDMEVMTLKGIYIFRQDKHSNEKNFISWSEDYKPPSSFLKRLKESQSKPSRDFLESFMDQNLEPNYRPRHYCTCPNVAKLSDIQVIQDMQARHLEQTDNHSTHDSQDRPPKPSRRPSYHSDWIDDEDGPIAKPMLQRPPTQHIIWHPNKTKNLSKSTDFW